MSNFLQRIITGIIYVAMVIGAIVWEQYVFSALFLIIAILGLIEFQRITFENGKGSNLLNMVFTGSVVYLIAALVANMILPVWYLWLVVPVLMLSFIAEIFLVGKNTVERIAKTALAVVYIVFPLAIFNFFFNPFLTYGIFLSEVLLGYFVILWVNDSGAYVVGKLVGKTPLFKSVSPKKTWEGVIGGAFFALLGAWILSGFFELMSLIEWIGIAVVIILFSTLGDLLESKMKRSYDIKDSGKLLPGHGGILDRFDGVLISVPFVFIYLLYILGN